MMVVVSGEMHSAYADLSEEVVEPGVSAVIAQGSVGVSERVAGMHLREYEGVAVLALALVLVLVRG